mmetsp:Transcript_34302/g.91668  ORF Transcript_34302/g.91668 Transcript_34302/m.91668 type:complete len:125 (+) Transcript_34302:2236-2610(+)
MSATVSAATHPNGRGREPMHTDKRQALASHTRDAGEAAVSHGVGQPRCPPGAKSQCEHPVRVKNRALQTQRGCPRGLSNMSPLPFSIAERQIHCKQASTKVKGSFHLGAAPQKMSFETLRQSLA